MSGTHTHYLSSRTSTAPPAVTLQAEPLAVPQGAIPAEVAGQFPQASADTQVAGSLSQAPVSGRPPVPQAVTPAPATAAPAHPADLVTRPGSLSLLRNRVSSMLGSVTSVHSSSGSSIPALVPGIPQGVPLIGSRLSATASVTSSSTGSTVPDLVPHDAAVLRAGLSACPPSGLSVPRRSGPPQGGGLLLPHTSKPSPRSPALSVQGLRNLHLEDLMGLAVCLSTPLQASILPSLP